jgi:hypothetical protein
MPQINAASRAPMLHRFAMGYPKPEAITTIPGVAPVNDLLPIWLIVALVISRLTLAAYDGVPVSPGVSLRSNW